MEAIGHPAGLAADGSLDYGDPPGERIAAVHPVVFGGQTLPSPFRSRNGLLVGEPLAGPAVILEAGSTIVVEPGWRQSCRPIARWCSSAAKPSPRCQAQWLVRGLTRLVLRRWLLKQTVGVLIPLALAGTVAGQRLVARLVLAERELTPLALAGWVLARRIRREWMLTGREPPRGMPA